jgi:hypothetical protein
MIPKEWLQSRMSETEVAALGNPKGRVTRRVRPFIASLRTFKAQLKPGDELWYFDSPTECWQNLGGCRGMAIVRDGDIVDTYVLMEN